MPNLHRKGKAIIEPSEVPEPRVRGTQRFHQFSKLESGNRRLCIQALRARSTTFERTSTKSRSLSGKEQRLEKFGD